jgi:hypothetical protein
MLRGVKVVDQPRSREIGSLGAADGQVASGNDGVGGEVSRRYGRIPARPQSPLERATVQISEPQEAVGQLSRR